MRCNVTFSIGDLVIIPNYCFKPLVKQCSPTTAARPLIVKYVVGDIRPVKNCVYLWTSIRTQNVQRLDLISANPDILNGA